MIGGKFIMKYKLSQKDMRTIVTGEITLTAVMAVCAIALVTVIMYKMFMSDKGSSTVPGGWKFTWN